MNKSDLLFQMMEQPQAYTDQQWQEILSDEECLELYTLMAKTQSTFDTQREVSDETIDTEWKRLTVSSTRRWHRVAAIFVGVLMLSGVAFAAIHIVRQTVRENLKSPTQETQMSTQHQQAPSVETVKTDTIAAMQPIVFDNVPLDKMLPEIAAYYHVEVLFQNEAARQYRFHFVWKCEDGLDHTIEKLKRFESLSVRRQDKKIVVE